MADNIKKLKRFETYHEAATAFKNKRQKDDAVRVVILKGFEDRSRAEKALCEILNEYKKCKKRKQYNNIECFLDIFEPFKGFGPDAFLATRGAFSGYYLLLNPRFKSVYLKYIVYVELHKPIPEDEDDDCGDPLLEGNCDAYFLSEDEKRYLLGEEDKDREVVGGGYDEVDP